MSSNRPGATVVVGIDASHAAVEAATWAIDEAIARHVPMRLVYVADPESTVPQTFYELPMGIGYSETVLRQAHMAIAESGKEVNVESAIVAGDPAEMLLNESHTAELVCVGSSGIGAMSKMLLGSVATALAAKACCPVAVIRPRDGGRQSSGSSIVVAVRASTQDEDAVVAAMQEARLRGASLLAIGLWDEGLDLLPHEQLDGLVQAWQQRYPDVRVQPVTSRIDLARFLDNEHAPLALIVIDAADTSRVADIIGPHGHPGCSVLVVRH